MVVNGWFLGINQLLDNKGYQTTIGLYYYPGSLVLQGSSSLITGYLLEETMYLPRGIFPLQQWSIGCQFKKLIKNKGD